MHGQRMRQGGAGFRRSLRKAKPCWLMISRISTGKGLVALSTPCRSAGGLRRLHALPRTQRAFQRAIFKEEKI
ncbi:hypothetical protein BTR14_20320 [Rhizobium rhizosphaerae]|uniref:Uncharacterized protein n=1 Tax=Xaviernesmea rhizosphaerae TaxID=1672749 RepID=A0ABX3P817_9HYPH|nr:hypothetical protein BTR14_20320 [Xaviernesmea rhizosphaerae]